MTSRELQALRRLLNFSRPEAAQLIAASPTRPAGVSDRAWRLWEEGERLEVPADVAERIRQLASWRAAAIDAAEAQIAVAPADASLALVWYDTLDDWATLPDREPVQWRPQQAVIAHLLGGHAGRVRIVAFDGPAYAAWLAGREDSEAMRDAWAASAEAPLTGPKP